MRELVTAAVLLLCAWPAGAGADDRDRSDADRSPTKGRKIQELVFQLAVPNEATAVRAEVEVLRQGKTRLLRLRDDGSTAGDMGHDGVFMGRDRGVYSRVVSLRLRAVVNRQPIRVLYEGLIRPVDAWQHHVAWRLERQRGKWIAVPTTAAYAGRMATFSEVLPTVANFGWGGFVLAVVALLVAGWRRERKATDQQ